jgi:hypothetical protein
MVCLGGKGLGPSPQPSVQRYMRPHPYNPWLIPLSSRMGFKMLAQNAMNYPTVSSKAP